MRFVLCVCSLLGSGLVLAQAPAAPLARAEQERFLATAKITNIRAARGGITATRRATRTDGAITHDAYIRWKKASG